MRISRRALLAGGASALCAPTVWAAPGITLNPHPSGDDWAQINAACATLRTAGRGWLMLEQTGSAPFNIKQCINATGLGNADFRFGAGAFLRCDGFVHAAPMIDLSNSWFSGVTGTNNIGGVIVGLDASSPAGTVKPACAILAAGGDSKSIKHIATGGKFGSAAIALIDTGDCDIEGGGHGNADDVAPTLMISRRADWGMWSPYTTFRENGHCQEIYVRSRFHAFGMAQWNVYLRDVSNLRFDQCFLAGAKRASILAQGSCDRVTLTGGVAGDETLPWTLQGVVECTAPGRCTNLRFYNFMNGALPTQFGGGDFSGLLVS